MTSSAPLGWDRVKVFENFGGRLHEIVGACKDCKCDFIKDLATNVPYFCECVLTQYNNYVNKYH